VLALGANRYRAHLGMTKRLLLLWISALFLLAGAALAGCGDDDDGGGGGGAGGEQGAELDTIRSGTLTVGSDIPYPPFEQGRPPDYDGFDIELITEIAERLELDTQIKDTPFDTIFRDLAQGKFDAVISGSTITDERERAVDFGDPYFLAEQSLLVQADSDVETIDDLAGETVGVQKGTTGEIYVKENAPDATVRSYGELDDAYNALVAGQVEAVMFDLPGNQEAARTKDGLAIRESYDTGEQFGIAFSEDADALREAANEALAEMKDDGTFAELYEKWFRKAPPKPILKATHSPK
jgi:ABC-type amino acid transport substrate-binding protein